MLARYQHQGITWIDLESPTRAEVQSLVEEFGIAPMVAEDLMLPSAKPRTDYHGDYIYAVMHFPAIRHSHRSKEQEIDFVIGKKFLITTHYDTVDPLHKFSKVFEVNTVLDKSNIGDHAGFLFFYMLRKLYQAVEHEVEFVQHNLTAIEEHVFSGREVEMVIHLSNSSRALLNLRQTIEPHRDALRSLEEEGGKLFGEGFAPYLKTISNEYYRVHNHIMRNSEAVHELRETNNSLLSTKQNETMKVFTILAFFTFPLTLIAAIFTLDPSHSPLGDHPYSFWIVLALQAVTATSLFFFFRFKKWL